MTWNIVWNNDGYQEEADSHGTLARKEKENKRQGKRPEVKKTDGNRFWWIRLGIRCDEDNQQRSGLELSEMNLRNTDTDFRFEYTFEK